MTNAILTPYERSIVSYFQALVAQAQQDYRKSRSYRDWERVDEANRALIEYLDCLEELATDEVITRAFAPLED